MSEIPFHKTVAGRHLFERQIPEFMKELRLLRSAVERLAAVLEKSQTPAAEENKK